MSHKGCLEIEAKLRAHIDTLERALGEIAKQKTFAELTEDGLDADADFEGGYDAIIEIARAALSETRKGRE